MIVHQILEHSHFEEMRLECPSVIPTLLEDEFSKESLLQFQQHRRESYLEFYRHQILYYKTCLLLETCTTLSITHDFMFCSNNVVVTL